MLEKLAEPRTLRLSFAVTVLLTICFQLIVHQFELTLLDGIADPTVVSAVISGMSDSQRSLHAWVTVTLDVAYPIAYGVFFTGSALHLFPSRGLLLSIPAIVCIPVDLVEGVVQVLALVGGIDWVQSKAILTPLKEFLFVVALLITMAGWFKWCLARVRGVV